MKRIALKPILRSVLSYLTILWKGKVCCNHLFRASEMQPRDENGMVKWQCCKCKEVFSATYGLKILEKGTCDGKWGEPNEFIRRKIERENIR